MSLFTEHDIMHFHKVLGFGCLVHYGYRFACRCLYGSMLFTENSIVSYATPIAHLTLSLSSFMFAIPTYRFNSKIMIWRELQLHNIIFTSRSAFMMYHTLLMNHTHPYYYYIRLGIVMAHHYAADFVSSLYQPDEKTTTREFKYDTNLSIIPYINKKYHAVSQLVATVTMLRSTNYENGLLIMFPIQLSTFLMTLVRKNIITNNQWHILYSMSLAIPFMLNTNKLSTQNDQLFMSIAFVISRLVLNVDKYINMVGLHAACCYWLK
jgi:hypothetical protein